jgi:hypothetical protein
MLARHRRRECRVASRSRIGMYSQPGWPGNGVNPNRRQNPPPVWWSRATSRRTPSDVDASTATFRACHTNAVANPAPCHPTSTATLDNSTARSTDSSTTGAVAVAVAVYSAEPRPSIERAWTWRAF